MALAREWKEPASIQQNRKYRDQNFIVELSQHNLLARQILPSSVARIDHHLRPLDQ